MAMRDHHFMVLTNQLSVDPLLPYLRHQNWLTPQEHEMIIATPHKKEMIIGILQQKNGRVWCDELFLKCIVWSRQFDLARSLGCTEHYIQQVLQFNPFIPAGNIPPVGNAWRINNPVITGPFPPPPGMHNIVAGRQWPPDEAGTAMETRNNEVPPHHPTYIVYSKDDDPCDYIRELSEFLNRCGVDCDIDQYHASENILDWGGWNEEVIKDRASRNGYILLVCSQKLHQQLRNPSTSLTIKMKAGHISNLALNALIKDENITNHIIPVFLEQYRRELVPSCLVGRSCYSICITKLLELANIHGNLETILNTPELESLRSLVCRLRGEPEVVKPPVPTVVTPPTPILGPIPPTPRIPIPPVVPQAPVTPSQAHNPPTNTQPPLSPKKTPKTEVEGEVKDEFLQKVADNIGKDWSRLGVRLGIEFRTLEQIRHGVPFDIRQQAYLMLVQWKETHKTVATMVELQDKLDELKLGRIGRLSRTI